MKEWKAKRFWTRAEAVKTDGGFGVRLDARPVMTPSMVPLVVPTLELASEIAAEWDAQTDIVDPRTMPMTRLANSAIDKVAPQRAEVAALLAAYGESDLLCYRAEGPAELAKRQVAAWNPVLDWFHVTHGVRLRVGFGVVPLPQPGSTRDICDAILAAFDSFGIAAFHDLVSLSGSYVLALALNEGHLSVGDAWDISQIDETWQREQWGADEDASAATAVKRSAFVDAARFGELSCKCG